jgi:hypothetical protein
MNRFPCFAVIALMLSGCVASTEESGDQVPDETDSLEAEITLKPGVNGGACALSDYNCCASTASARST